MGWTVLTAWRPTWAKSSPPLLGKRNTGWPKCAATRIHETVRMGMLRLLINQLMDVAVGIFIVRQRWLHIIFAILLFWLSGFEFWRRETFTVPLDQPISLSTAGKFEHDFRVRVDTTHELTIRFSKGTRSREEAMRLVGSRWDCREKTLKTDCDASVPLRWILTDQFGKVVVAGEGETHGMTGHASDEFWRTVVPSIYVQAGHYHLSATILRDVPEFHGMTAHLSFALPGGKRSFGWQSDLAFWGGLINFFVLIPMTGSFGMILIGQGLGAWVRSRRRVGP